jgi:hypothetical protein
MESPAAITRRRALVLGAVAGLGSLFARAPLPAWGRRGTAAARGFGLDVPAAAFAGGRTSGVLRAPRRFDLLGLRGVGSGAEVRVRRHGGTWSGWVPFGAGDSHGPDKDVADLPSDPVWAGGADELQLRLDFKPARDLRVHFVAVGAAAKRHGARSVARAAAKSAQAGPGSPPPIIPRAGWGGDKIKPRAAPSYGAVQVAFVHHTVTANDYTADQSAGIVLGIAKYHRDTLGWNDIGYNFLVDKYGQVFEGRAGGIDQAVIGAQAQGYNRLSTGISNIGTYSDVPQGSNAIEVVARLIGWKMSLHGSPVEGTIEVVSGGGDLNRYPNGKKVTLNRISGHRDGDQTACPGNALYAQLPDIRTRAKKYATAVATGERLTMTALAARVAYGKALTLKGTFIGPDGLPVGNTKVNIQKHGDSGTWTTIAAATTAVDGEWQVDVPWRRAGAVRARGKAPGAVASAVSATSTVDIDPVLDARALTRRVTAGQRVAVAGTLHPDGAVRMRVERQLSNGKWLRGGDVVLRSRSGVFRGRILLRAPGLYRLTPRAGVAARPVAAPALFVRAVRPTRRGGGAQAPGGPTGGTGGASA